MTENKEQVQAKSQESKFCYKNEQHTANTLMNVKRSSKSVKKTDINISYC